MTEQPLTNNIVKFAWAFLLTHGRLTLGLDPQPDPAALEAFRQQAIEIGIDYKKSAVPVVMNSIDFLVVLGILVLKNNYSQALGLPIGDIATVTEVINQILRGEKNAVTELMELI